VLVVFAIRYKVRPYGVFTKARGYADHVRAVTASQDMANYVVTA